MEFMVENIQRNGSDTVDRIPFLPFFLQSFPESTIFLALGLQWTGVEVKLKKILPLALVTTGFSYLVRALPIVYGVHSVIQLFFMVILVYLFLKLNWRTSIVAILIGGFAVAFAEGLIDPVIWHLLNIEMSVLLAEPWLRVLVPLPHMTLLALLAVLSKRKGWVLVKLPYEIQERPKASFLFIIVLFQALLILLLNAAFYAYRSGNFLSMKLDHLYGIVNVILVTISITTIFIANRLLKLTKQEIILEEQGKQMEALQEPYLAVRTQRHDFLNHVTALYGMLKTNKFSAAQEYMESLYSEVKNSNTMMNIGIPALSGLLHTKSGIAWQRDIEFRLDVDYDFHTIPLDPVDLTGIIGNLIDNALEAVPEEGEVQKLVKVELLHLQWENTFYVNVINTANKLAQDTLEKLLSPGYSTKDKHSGIGLSSVQHIVKKYGGEILLDYDQEESLFKVQVKIPSEPV